MALPNFLVIGAGRSGTTSLHHCLGQHSDVYMSPVKSPNFFVAGDRLPDWEVGAARAMAGHWIRDRQAYEALFEGVRAEKAIGEVSPVYLQSIAAPRRILEASPDVRLVAVLRDPVERAWAHFLGRRRDGIEARRRFAEIVEEELALGLPLDVAFGSYVGAGHYHHFLSEYCRLFPAERIRIYLFEDLREAPDALLSDLLEFLGVDPGLEMQQLGQFNATGDIRSPILRRVWTGSVGIRTSMRPRLPETVRNGIGRLFLRRLDRAELDRELRAKLVAHFRPEIEKLANLIGRDLDAWLDPTGASAKQHSEAGVVGA